MDINIWNLFFNILQYLIRESLLIVNQYNEKTCCVLDCLAWDTISQYRYLYPES